MRQASVGGRGRGHDRCEQRCPHRRRGIAERVRKREPQRNRERHAYPDRNRPKPRSHGPVPQRHPDAYPHPDAHPDTNANPFADPQTVADAVGKDPQALRVRPARLEQQRQAGRNGQL